MVSVEAEVDEGPGGDLDVRQVLLVRPLLPLAVALHAQRRRLKCKHVLAREGTDYGEQIPSKVLLNNLQSDMVA